MAVFCLATLALSAVGLTANRSVIARTASDHVYRGQTRQGHEHGCGQQNRRGDRTFFCCSCISNTPETIDEEGRFGDGPDNKSGNKMWGGRFASGPDAVMEAINASIDFDRKLYAQDIAGSKAHARMLARQGIIAADRCRQNRSRSRHDFVRDRGGRLRLLQRSSKTFT